VEAYDSATVEGRGAVTVVSWLGKPGVKVMERAIWIERGDESGPPVVHAAVTP
jgi:hypothetical protein